MHQSIRSLDLFPPPPFTTGNPPRIWFYEDWFVQIPNPLGQKLCSNVPPKFFIEGKISDHDFLHINQI